MCFFCNILDNPAVDAQIVINELDPSGPGIDDMEFVELYGVPGVDLSGITVVIYNGSNALSNNAFDLTGYSLWTKWIFSHRWAELSRS
jgi:hypothetical protein